MGIRKMNFSDLNDVANLYKDANSFSKLNDIKIWTLNGLKKYPEYNLVFEQKGKIIAAISAIKKSKNILEINDLAVLKNKRNKSNGTRLLTHFFKNNCDPNIKKIVLWVHWKNSEAIPFYYAFGFSIKKVLKTKNIKGVPNGEDVILLEKLI